jgi:predicted lysophospholipase L1 biosynthesis ABC-type transport system permease subunit
VGGTPALVAGILLAKYLALAVIAAAAGLVVGRLAAPLLTTPGAGLLGTAGTPQLTPATIGLVLAVALAVATLASFFPALRAARTSTIHALAVGTRQPRRRASARVSPSPRPCEQTAHEVSIPNGPWCSLPALPAC